MSGKKKYKKQQEDFGDIDQYDDDNITDSDDQFSDSERQLLEKVRKKRVTENFDSDDEVFGLNLEDEAEDDDDDDEGGDSMESDIERPQEDDDDDMPDERAWGKKGLYYSTDYVDQDYSTTNEKDLQKAKLEEEAARTIQQRLAGQLDDADFGLDQFIVSKDDDDDKDDKDHDDVIVKTDLTKLSKREKQALMLKENPEFESLVNDSKDRLREVKEILRPFLKLAKAKDLPDTSATNFIKVKYQLALNYLTNIMFYFTLKAKKIPITNHPVIKRLAQYRQLLTQLENSQGDLLDKAAEILAAEREGKELYIIESNVKTTDDMAKSNISAESVDNNDEDISMEDSMMKDDQDEESMQLDESQQENLEDQKRGITYQIAKNKGLTPHRKKELRNPRVKHRNKYRKATIRRKGAVREVRKETTRYAGELSGIKASVSKSIKLK